MENKKMGRSLRNTLRSIKLGL